MISGPALLFCPGDRPDRYGKAAQAADTVIIDLEDAVALHAKPAARRALIASELDPSRTIVRVNPRSTGLLDDDLAALHQTGYRHIALAKAETLDDLAALEGFDVLAICESPLGVRNAEMIAESSVVVALTWGAEDLVAAMGGTSSRHADGSYRAYAMYARSRVLIASTSAGKSAFDTVHLDIADDEGLRDEASDAAASGFAGAMCIHPRQVEIIRGAFRPSDESVAWAHGVLQAAAAIPEGVFAYDGRMIDEPVLRQARRIVGLAAPTSSDEAI
ncbi:MAG: CoA ester lyase [Actinomycetota bacterium]|nr:CoA ester lyase [Actinomycetota bacterium]